MPLKNLTRIEEKIGMEGITHRIAEGLTGSELNSLLLEIFRLRTKTLKPSVLLNAYGESRFTRPSDLSPAEVLSMKAKILSLATEKGFTPVELSPLMPFGTCSVMAPVDQNNVISALRGTEVLSDITNALALEACAAKRNEAVPRLDLCACERTTRAQSFDNPKFSAHFQLHGMVSAGKDTGDYTFERETILKHIEFYIVLLESLLDKPELYIQLTAIADKKGEIHESQKIIPTVTGNITRYPVKFGKALRDFSYYQHLRCAIFLVRNGEEHMIIDGGFTDWSQKLLNNKKERMYTSGLGVEYLIKIMKR